jgi:molecular chaperone GrpE
MNDNEKQLDDLERAGDGESTGSSTASQAPDGIRAPAQVSQVEVSTDEPRSDAASKPAPDGLSEAAIEPIENLLEKARADSVKMRDQMLRVAADFDNYRKRTRREIEEAGRRAREELLREMLPVFDNLERAVAHADQAADVRSMADGVKMVLKQFLDTLGKLGVRRVQTVGAAFDPTIHEAIQQIATNEQPPGTVVAEVQPGYAWEERLLRAAMVVVAKAQPVVEQERDAEPSE